MVLEKTAYLNAGTDGPLPRTASTAMQRATTYDLKFGRGDERYFNYITDLWEKLRETLAGVLGVGTKETALTRSTTDGINAVLRGLQLSPSDEVLTSDEEHPGLLAPLAALQKQRGVTVRQVPLEQIASAVSSKTSLVACSHVSWMTGRRAPLEDIAELSVPLLVDGAQALGAIEVDVAALGCEFYAGPGHKWLCGPDSTGVLFVRSDWTDRLALAWPHYGSLAEPKRPLDLEPKADSARFDSGFLPAVLAAGLLGSVGLLCSHGWSNIFERGTKLAHQARSMLSDSVRVEPADTTLVSWHSRDAALSVKALASEGIVVRDIPASSLVRASVGAWTSEVELEQLAEAVARFESG